MYVSVTLNVNEITDIQTSGFRIVAWRSFQQNDLMEVNGNVSRLESLREM